MNRTEATNLEELKTITQNFRAHHNNLENLRRDIDALYIYIYLRSDEVPRSALAQFVTGDILSILADFINSQVLHEDKCLEAVTALCWMLRLAFGQRPGVVDGKCRRLLIKGLSQPRFQIDIARTIIEIASNSGKFRCDLKNDGIEETITQLASILRENEDYCNITQVISVLFDPHKKCELLKTSSIKDRVDFIHALLWMLDEGLQYTIVIEGETILKRYMPILTEALQENPDREGKVAGMACLVLRHFFTHDFNSCAETVIRADLIPHIVNRLSCSNVAVILQTSRCIAHVGRNPKLCKLFIEWDVIARLKEKIDTNPVNARIFGPVCFALRGISDGLAVHELNKIPNHVIRRVESLSTASINLNVKKVARFFLDAIEKRQNVASRTQ